MAVDPHRLAEARSLAAHKLIADRLAHEPALIDMARERVASWLADGSVARDYARAWRDILASDLFSIRRALVEDSERGRALRQCTPFAGAIDPRTRWQLWARVREELEANRERTAPSSAQRFAMAWSSASYSSNGWPRRSYSRSCAS